MFSGLWLSEGCPSDWYLTQSTERELLYSGGLEAMTIRRTGWLASVKLENLQSHRQSKYYRLLKKKPTIEKLSIQAQRSHIAQQKVFRGPWNLQLADW